MTVQRPALRYHGGKFRLAPWIISFFPPHRIYVEPFGGAAGVLLQKPRSYAEVYNDLDGDIANFFRVIRNPEQRDELIKQLVATPYHREEFELAYQQTENAIERARRTAIRAQMGFGSAGATKGKTGFRIDTKREYETAQHTWAMYPDAVRAAGERLSGVLIENTNAITVMQQHDTPETLHYVDPPYVLDTRIIGSRAYLHEMTDEQHLELLAELHKLKGYVVLSGYASTLYDTCLQGWERHETKARIAAGRGTGIRTEVVWLNPACAEARLGVQQSLGLETAQ